jgi:hypothetical protein
MKIRSMISASLMSAKIPIFLKLVFHYPVPSNACTRCPTGHINRTHITLLTWICTSERYQVLYTLAT